METFVNFFISLKILKLCSNELSPNGSSINFEILSNELMHREKLITKMPYLIYNKY